MLRQILILYGTSYGQTAKIALRMRDVLTARGYRAVTLDAEDLPHGLDMSHYDGVILGSSVVATGHQRSVTRFIREHVASFASMPTAFFSVSASAGSSDEAGRADAHRVLHDYLARLDWQPDLSATVAGAVLYTRYNPILRWFMKRAAAAHGGSTDTSRDHEYTDWDQVERFASAFADRLDELKPMTPSSSAVVRGGAKAAAV